VKQAGQLEARPVNTQVNKQEAEQEYQAEAELVAKLEEN